MRERVPYVEIAVSLTACRRLLLKPGMGRDSAGTSRPIPATKIRDESTAHARPGAGNARTGAGNPGRDGTAPGKYNY